MKYKEKIINNQNGEILKQLNSLTAYGIDGFTIAPIPDGSIGNEDIEADKENLREQ